MAPKPIKVSQLNAYIKRILQADPILSNISVSGEISNLKYHGTGNVYFTMKDETSKLNCFLGSEYLRNIAFELADGLQVVASGSLYVYERGGYYSLNVRDIAAAGEGALSAAFNRLREKLEREGLFDPSAKKPLPAFPAKIAVVTSETGAAVRDIITTIRNRNRYVQVIVFPCLVQGPGAASEIAETIRTVNTRFPDCDVMIVGRGGGSMEELWAFNEEIVARSIHGSRIPVISAVGHETDFTIADFTADVRAATPTAAAQMAVPDTLQLALYLDELAGDCRRHMDSRLRLFEMKINANDLSSLRNLLLNKIELARLKADRQMENCRRSLDMKLAMAGSRLEALRTAIESLDPSGIMKKGYCVLRDPVGNYITSVHQTAVGSRIAVIVSDGTLDCSIERIAAED